MLIKRTINTSVFFVIISSILLFGCHKTKDKPSLKKLDKIASEYVKLCLRIDKHHKGFVDAYIGDEKIKLKIDKEEKIDLLKLKEESEKLLNELSELKNKTKRTKFLEKQITAANTFIRKLSGEEFSLFEEARLLYDIEPQMDSEESYSETIKDINKILPGKSNALEKLEKYRKPFILKKEEILPAIEKALQEVRKRTKQFLPLPPDEDVKINLVTDKPWGGYNWFKGNFYSLIEINTDLPRRIDQILGYIAHEGYPGHHTELCLKENFLYRGKNYIEFSVYPLYSPASVISEGTAELGLEIIFTEKELLKFLKDEMFPLVGLKNIDTEKWNNIRKSLKKLSSVTGNAAILLLEKNKKETEVINYIKKFGLLNEETAKKQIDFIKTYRAYVFNYYYGYNLLKIYVEKGNPKDLFKKIILQHAYPSYF
ncbi:MAG: hypothetical protein HWN67_13410 [Candidatus Helarchaeota archaeon]|nr:hypothetical protein [Candidatus Helarchaeota archaeon]